MPARCDKQVAKLFFSALTSAGKNQHLEIEELAGREIIAGLNDAVDDEKTAVRIHAFSAGFEELDRPQLDNWLMVSASTELA